MRLMERLWRWLTLADAPVNKASRYEDLCQVCGEPATCRATIKTNNQPTTLLSCSPHIEAVIGGLTGQEVTYER